jgi:hypothetical protein
VRVLFVCDACMLMRMGFGNEERNRKRGDGVLFLSAVVHIHVVHLVVLLFAHLTQDDTLCGTSVWPRPCSAVPVSVSECWDSLSAKVCLLVKSVNVRALRELYHNVSAARQGF